MIRLTVILFAWLFGCSQHNADTTATAERNYSDKHTEALAYCKKNGFCQDYYFLADLSVHSGKNRFFVYDFKQQKTILKNLVTHGACDAFEANATAVQKVKFSNRIDSHCSASGKYKVGSRDYSSWGIHVKYWLEGLEESNDNAKGRVIVLHSWDAVANTEIYPNYSPLSWGCPAVSDSFMRTLDAKLQATKKPVLLWITE